MRYYTMIVRGTLRQAVAIREQVLSDTPWLQMLDQWTVDLSDGLVRMSWLTSDSPATVDGALNRVYVNEPSFLLWNSKPRGY